MTAVGDSLVVADACFAYKKPVTKKILYMNTLLENSAVYMWPKDLSKPSCIHETDFLPYKATQD